MVLPWPKMIDSGPSEVIFQPIKQLPCLSTCSGISRFSRPLEAQPISVGIAKVELLHPMWRDFRGLKLKALRTQFLIDRVHIAAVLILLGICR
jgi:hypothetical protein